jgi:hypothetical protein
MKRIGLFFSLIFMLVVVAMAQDVTVFHLDGIDNNGTTVKRYSFDPAQAKPTQKPFYAVSDSAFVMKGQQLNGKELLGSLSKFLNAPVTFTGDTTDVYDLDLDIKMDFPQQAVKVQVLEELGFVLEKVVPKK